MSLCAVREAIDLVLEAVADFNCTLVRGINRGRTRGPGEDDRP